LRIKGRCSAPKYAGEGTGTSVIVQSLRSLVSNYDETVASVIGRIYNLFSQPKRLSLSGGVVIASKTAHMIMPELFIMIDHRIMKKLHEVSDYYPHPSDGEGWYDVISNYSGHKLNPYSGYAWDFDQRYLAALMYYKRIILEWCQQNNTDITGFLQLGIRTVTNDIVRGSLALEYKDSNETK